MTAAAHDGGSGRGELLRKALHMGAASGALLLRWTGWGWGLAMAATGILFNALLLHRLTGGRLLRAHEAERGDSWGSLSYPVMVLLLILTFPGRLDLAAAAWGILALGDGSAGLVGRWMGGPRLPWNGRKSWSGLVGFVAVGWPAAVFLAWWTGGAPAVSSGVGLEVWVVACGLAAVAAAVAESLDSAMDDNVLVPVAAAVTLAGVTASDPVLVADILASLPGSGVLLGATGLGVAALVALVVGAVTPSGAVGGWALVTVLLIFGGWTGVLVFSVFFGVGTGATWLGHQRKVARGVAHQRGGRRGATHAAANAGAGVAFAVVAATSAHPGPLAVAMVAAFATAAADTVASEVGQAYGRVHLLVTTLRRVPPGTEGAVSMEGTLAGVGGAALVAAAAWATAVVTPAQAVMATAGALVGTSLESLAGAVLPRQRPADNGLLNLGATLAGGLAALAAAALLS